MLFAYRRLKLASLAAGAFPQVDSAFDVCLNARRGEALSLFVDDEPTHAYLPLAYDYQGRAREAIATAGSRLLPPVFRHSRRVHRRSAPVRSAERVEG